MYIVDSIKQMIDKHFKGVIEHDKILNSYPQKTKGETQFSAELMHSILQFVLCFKDGYILCLQAADELHPHLLVDNKLY